MALATPEYEHWFPSDWVGGISDALHDPPALSAQRRTQFRNFQELPVEPNPLYRKYAYFAGVDLHSIDPGGTGPAAPVPPLAKATIRIVHDAAGSHAEVPGLIQKAGVEVQTLPEILATERGQREILEGMDPPPDRLVALGNATVNRAVRVIVPDRCPLPVRVQELTIFTRPSEALSVRRRIHVGEQTRLLFDEEVYSAPGTSSQRFHSSATSLSVGGDARAAFLSVHAPDPHLVSLSSREAVVGTRSHLSWLWAGFGGFRARNRMETRLSGQGSSCDDLQTFYGDGEQSYDSSVRMVHVGTDTHGQSITRGVFKDRARGASRGLVRIEAEARKTLSFLSEHAMLLSKDARSDTIPILEILCRDVKATHSSSVAPVDPEKVFYLQSRGLSEFDSVRMIGEGFLSHVLEKAPVTRLRDLLYPILAQRWEGREVVWEPSRFPSLPPLEISGEKAAEEWRFDSKLR